ncbi:hypothetical protein Cs7R123_00450 [Catellatospora sp. TT07R-123]|uniref:hypothetical protein n=1 Tax=Catellatospora sp. TT07R-123 TaxID=2733863 RepID=UPI001B10BF08|nr:hypothetical protein [Catellatospora sp. TT07R-123]GHJ42703.1 hypothetical protein Cs7R123_00450 [Catellatospora sp. TT07R-123]
MGRNAPGQVRADLHRRRRPGERIAAVEGVSARGQAVIARWERTRGHPGAVHAALRLWQDFARADRTGREHLRTCGEYGCCADPPRERRLLDSVLAVLPPADARTLRRRLEPLDALISQQDLAPEW